MLIALAPVPDCTFGWAELHQMGEISPYFLKSFLSQLGGSFAESVFFGWSRSWNQLSEFKLMLNNVTYQLPTNLSYNSVLRSRNYLFPAPTLTIISTPAPATAIY